MLAIDFGTSNTCVTRINPVTGQSETLSIPGLSQQIGANPPLIPSLVYVENAAEGKVLIGQQVRDRLTFENDEYSYSSTEILEVCKKSGVPMVFDAHHHICHEGLTTYDDPSVAEMFYAARETWTNPDWQLVHISNGQNSFGDRTHSDFITDMPSVYREAPWIEIEAKAKEAAIARVEAEWLMRK